MSCIAACSLFCLALGVLHPQDAPTPPAVSEDLYVQGDRLLREGRLPEAREAFERSARRNPISPWPHLGLSRVLFEEERYGRALIEIDRGVQKAEKLADVERRMLLFRANVYYQMARLDDASADLAIVLEGEPANADAIYQLGHIRLHQEQFDEAQTLGRKLLRSKSRRNEGYYLMGMALFKKGNLESARGVFESNLRLDPSHLKTRYTLVQVLRRLGDNEGAERQLAIHKALHEATMAIEKALRQGSGGTCAHCWRILSVRYGELGQFEKALGYAERVVVAGPDDPGSLCVLALTQMALERHADSVSTYRKCIELHPEFGLAYVHLAWLLATAEKVKDPAEAIRLAQEARKLGEEEVGTLAEAHYQGGQKEEAISLLEEAISAGHSSAGSYRAQLERIRAGGKVSVLDGPPASSLGIAREADEANHGEDAR